jgi:hypothetical protein
VRIWDGGLGIWGAVTLGALGAGSGASHGHRAAAVGDAIAPGIALAQAIGRFGNWFNQELFGAPTSLPWGLQIDPAFRPAGYEGFDTFHPTFLYESAWMVGVALVLIWADRRFQMGHGRVFALYVALYCAGRLWIDFCASIPPTTSWGFGSMCGRHCWSAWGRWGSSSSPRGCVRAARRPWPGPGRRRRGVRRRMTRSLLTASNRSVAGDSAKPEPLSPG